MARGDGPVLSHWHVLMEDFNTSVTDLYANIEEALARRSLPDTDNHRITHYEGGILSAQREYLRVERGSLIFDICASPFGTGFFVSWWLVKKRNPFFGFWLLAVIVLLLLVIYNLVRFLMIQVSGFLMGGSAGCGTLLLVGFFLVLLGLLGQSAERFGMEDDVLALPYLGPLYNALYNPLSYFKQDSILMFQDAVRGAVNEVVTSLRDEHGIRALTKDELEPSFSRFRN